MVYCRQAGAKAMARLADREAETCFTQALEALQHLPKQRDTLEQAIDLRFDLRHALARLGDYDQVLVILHEAETLAQTLDDHRRLAQVAAFIAYHYALMGDYHQAVAPAQRTLVSAEVLGDFTLQVLGNFHLGLAYHGLGDYRRAIDYLRSNVAALEGEHIYESFATPGLPSVASRSVLVRCLTELGVFAEAIALGEEAVRIAETVNNPDMLASACRSTPVPYLRKGDLPKAIPLLEHGLGLLYLKTRRQEQARAALSAAMALYHAMDMTFWLPQTEAALAQGGSTGAPGKGGS